MLTRIVDILKDTWFDLPSPGFFLCSTGDVEMPKKILLIEDDADIVEICCDYLNAAGFDVATAQDGKNGILAARREKPDLIVLDLMLPNMNGLDVCREIRRESNVPIIILTALSDETDVLIGLEIGADDYMTKPFSPRELVARVRAFLRRTSAEASSEILRVGEVLLDRSHYEAQLPGRNVSLTATEFEILAILMSQPGRIFSRSQLTEAVHGVSFESYERAINSHINNIRRKLEPGKYIVTIHGIGYKFVD
jgi:two-component system alkaline phosphatase synthesis response regulator PhoP